MKNTLITLLLIILLSGCVVTNRYNEYRGKVIDTETKVPIEGAAVLVVYKTEQYGLAGSVAHFEDAQEVLTDKNGEFIIRSKRIITFRVLSGWERYPQFNIFKPGYGCYPNHKDVKPMFVPNGTLPSNQYVTIELPNVRLETHESRLENYGCYPSELVPEFKYKKLFHLIQQERLALGLDARREP